MRRPVLMLLWIGIGLLAMGGSALCEDVMYVTSQYAIPPNLLTYDPVTIKLLKSVPVTGIARGYEGVSSLTRDGSGLWAIYHVEDGTYANNVFKIDPLTGTGTVVGTAGFDGQWALENHPQTDALYALVATQFADQLYTVDKVNGAATLVATITGPIKAVTALAIDANGIAYVTDEALPGNPAELFVLNLATGEATRIGDLTGLQCDINSACGFRDLAFDSSGQLWGDSFGQRADDGAHVGAVYTIDINSGAVTWRFNTGHLGEAYFWGGIAFGPAAQKTGLPLCVKWKAFCDGVQIDRSGLGGAQWYHFDCASNSPMDAKLKTSGTWTSNCGRNGKGIARSLAPNGPGDWYFVMDVPLDGSLDMHQGTYPNGSCWIPDLAYDLQMGACTGVNGQAARSSIQ